MSCFRVQHQLCKHYGTQGHSWGKLHVCIGVVFVSFQSTLKALGHDMMPMSLTVCVRVCGTGVFAIYWGRKATIPVDESREIKYHTERVVVKRRTEKPGTKRNETRLPKLKRSLPSILHYWIM